MEDVQLLCIIKDKQNTYSLSKLKHFDNTQPWQVYGEQGSHKLLVKVSPGNVSFENIIWKLTKIGPD